MAVLRATIILLNALLVFVLAYIFSLPVYHNSGFEKGLNALKLSSVEMTEARADYLLELWGDPATGKIPSDIRDKELRFAERLKAEKKEYSSVQSPEFKFRWLEAGPGDVGGRTRALAIDIENPDIVLAGGVSGGLWRSTDKGESWFLVSDPSESHSVSALAQDPRPGNTNNWYYGTGEFRRNSVYDQIFSENYYGSGIYKSTDNGKTWRLLENARSKPLSKDGKFNFISRISVSPRNGYIYVATNGSGIMRSTDGGESFEYILGGQGIYYYSDAVITLTGRVYATLSESGNKGGRNYIHGIYYSNNDGENWVRITPPTFPASHLRTVLATAPSNPDILYAYTYVGWGENKEDVRFHYIDLSTNTFEDRSEFLPNFTNLMGVGIVNTQACYNMALAIKPDDENFVILGGTNLFRSQDGFSSGDYEWEQSHIGGYSIYGSYINNHPDHHALFFDPSDPNKLWNGHDGGLSYCEDITMTNWDGNFYPWISKNNGYNVTQFWAVSLPLDSDDYRLIGGTQDNGSYLLNYEKGIEPSYSIFGGDGTECFFMDDFAFVSFQFGYVAKLDYNDEGLPDGSLENSYYVHPRNAQTKFFHPYAIDPNDQNTMVFPSGRFIYRSNKIDEQNSQGPDSLDTWERIDKLSVPGGYHISAISFSNSNPKHLLYYGCSGDWETPKVPRLYKVENGNSATDGAIELQLPNIPRGAHFNKIAINPLDANEILVVFSNYNVNSLYYSNDGGNTFSVVDGNLEGDEELTGPAISSAVILPTEEGNVFIVGTTIGVFATSVLDGENTIWSATAKEIGNVPVMDLDVRASDYTVAVGTYGRGIFIGKFDPGIQLSSEFNIIIQNTAFPNPASGSATIKFNIPVSGYAIINLYDIKGQIIKQLAGRTFAEGENEVSFNTFGIAPGTYFYRIELLQSSSTGKIIIKKS